MPKFELVAERRLQAVGNPTRVVSVQIGRPYKIKNEWRAPYRVLGIGRARTGFAVGEDAVQALMIVFEAVRADLDREKTALSWLSGEPGDVGFPRLIPTSFGQLFMKECESLMDKQVFRLMEKLRKRRRLV